MPTRPVTWDIEAPPDQRAQNAAGNGENEPKAPALADLRGSLIGTRFELLKIATFAAFLCAVTLFAIQGTDVANPNNQFTATTSVALGGLVDTVSGTAKTVLYSASVEGRQALAKVASLGNTPTANAAVQVALPTHGTHHLKGAKHPSHVEYASFHPPTGKHRHRKQLAQPEVDPTIYVPPIVRWSGNVLDLPDFVSAETSVAYHSVGAFIHGSAESFEVPDVRSHGQQMVNSLRNHLDVTDPDSFAVHGPSAMVSGALNADTAVAAAAALMLYMMFVVVMVQMRGGFRAARRHPAT